MIKNDAVFTNHSRNPQDPVSYQLLLALCRFGGYGNKTSYMDVADKLGVSGAQYDLICDIPMAFSDLACA